jgi:hypothetical protein
VNVELSEAEPLPARSDQRRRRIRKTFTSDELDARHRPKHSMAMLVLWNDMWYESTKCKKEWSRWKQRGR